MLYDPKQVMEENDKANSSPVNLYANVSGELYTILKVKVCLRCRQRGLKLLRCP